jgi:PAS domain S-box-containing protein
MKEDQPGQIEAPDQQAPDRRYWDLLEAAPDGILEVSADGAIVLVNAVAAKMFGYDRSELIGKPVEDLVPSHYRDLHVKHRAGYWARPQTRSMGSGLALSALRRDGTEFPVEISLSPVAYPDAFRVIAIVRDVTERQRAEDKIRVVREQYTAELAIKNQELAARNQEAEKANRMKSEFLASMSHELRTPLHTVIGFSELLLEELEGPLNAKQRRFLGHIKQDSQHLLELINDILDLSKIEAGRLELRPEEFDVAGAVEEVIGSVRLPADEKFLALQSHVAPDLLLYADRVRFKAILYNLLSNAVKFTPEHGRIDVTCTVETETLVTSVRDTGIGISAEEHALIFDNFHQVGSTTKGVREGTGLGLAITKRLVELHSGSIEVQSELGKGAEFIVRLPLDRRVSPTRPNPDRSRPLVLVVEDEPNASELVVSYLSSSGFDTLTATNAGEAVQKAIESLPDAITLDLLIPGGKGWKVLTELKRKPETSSIPIIVVSVLEERQRALQLGATDYLVKPVSRDVLVAAVGKHAKSNASSTREELP